MSERTTIGGTVYETVGSSSSNLLLKCNGTARIQWGTKLIDLIKNGKLASGDSSLAVSVISDLSEIKSDGFYILNTDKSSELWICKDGKQYDISGTDLYISASTKQNINAEQKKQALENIGMYYSTLEELKSAEIQHGLVYVLEDNNLYIIKDGVISEFEAKVKTVTIDEKNEQGEIINSSFQIVLSVLDEEYLVLKNRRITANYDVVLKDSAKVCSEGSSEVRGYRLYMKEGYSYLDIDRLNVRSGIPIPEYIQVTYSEFKTCIVNKTLEPHRWYLITDYQNPWKIPENNYKNNRPILIRALTTSTIYKEGQLFKDRRVTIQYDPFYEETIELIDDSGNLIGETEKARGKIVWMKDGFNNEANFDFLNYEDALRNSLTTLHKVFEDDSLDLSIFPENSYNNKLIVYDLKGTVIKNGIFDNTNVTTIEFKDTVLNMHDNNIECRGLVVSCENFYNNTLKELCNVSIDADFINNNLTSIYTVSDNRELDSFINLEDNNIFSITQFSHKFDTVTFNGFINSVVNNTITSSNFNIIRNSTINESIYNSSFNDIIDCIFHCQFSKVKFMSLTNCTFNTGVIYDTTCFGDLYEFTFDSEVEDYILLYDTSKTKEIYVKKDVNGNTILEIVSVKEQSFVRGMIIMHSGIGGIPTGWAICDGGEYEYDGIKSTTPDLRGRFIKSITSSEETPGPSKDLDVNENNEFQLKKEHLPEHNHPHKPHKHTFEGSDSDTVNITISTAVNTLPQEAVITVEGGVTGYSGDSVEIESSSDSDTVSITISGETSEETSQEDTQEWENKAFKIEPNYYSLIFIMKL